MSSESPLLTIAIPTYNRSRYLARLLGSLVPQLEAEGNGGHGVELIISDNASPDDTSEVVEQYRHRKVTIRSLRNQTNLGADGNIAQCFAEASGRYVWIIGDDDVVLPGAIAFVISLLGRDEYDIVHLRAGLLIEGEGAVGRTRPPRIRVIDDARTFTLKTHVFLTFITGNIVNKQRVLALPHRPFSELIGTSLVQLGWTYTALSSFRKGAYVIDPIVAASGDDRGGYPLVAVFGTNLKRITETWLVRPELLRIVLNGTLQTFFPRYVLHLKLERNSFSEEKYEHVLHGLFSHRYRYYFFIYPLIRFSGSAARAWLFLCRIINRVDRALGNPMLR